MNSTLVTLIIFIAGLGVGFIMGRLSSRASMTSAQDMASAFQRMMMGQSESLGRQNKEQLDSLLSPLKDKINEFNKELIRDRAVLGEQIKNLSDTSSRMTSETSNLTKALKGQAQTQGAWGEMILTSILEQSGLREGAEFFAQQSHTTDQGERIRPDVIVRLPRDQNVVLDSKVSLKAFHDFVNAGDEEARAGHIKSHIASIRRHIQDLGKKEYQKVTDGSMDYVIMFIPIEGAWVVAQKEDPDLLTYAIKNNVAIAVPSSLIAILKTISSLWQSERRQKNAEDIANRAGKIYDKLCGFVEDMGRIETGLNAAHKAFDSAMDKLGKGSGNLLRQVEQLKELGAKTQKALPAPQKDID